MKIVTVPDPHLKKTSKKVEKFDKKLIRFVEDLQNTLIHKQNPAGVGLSAPQVAKNLRIFTIFFNHKNPNSVETLINPEILDISEELILDVGDKKPYLEGCLSIPDTYGLVWRHQQIKLQYIKIDGSDFKEVTTSYNNFEARVIQHEYDHIEGILFTDRSLEQELPMYREENGELVEINF